MLINLDSIYSVISGVVLQHQHRKFFWDAPQIPVTTIQSIKLTFVEFLPTINKSPSSLVRGKLMRSINSYLQS